MTPSDAGGQRVSRRRPNRRKGGVEGEVAFDPARRKKARRNYCAAFWLTTHAPGDNRPQWRSMDAVILPVSCCDTNALVRVGILPVLGAALISSYAPKNGIRKRHKIKETFCGRRASKRKMQFESLFVGQGTIRPAKGWSALPLASCEHMKSGLQVTLRVRTPI